VVLALDESGSIGLDDFSMMTEFISRAMLSLDLSNRDTADQGVRVGLLTFGSAPKLHFHLNQYLASDTALLSALHVPYGSGTTNTADAIKYASKSCVHVMCSLPPSRFVRENMFTAENGDRPLVPNYLVVITDGKSDAPNATWREAMTIRREGVTVFAVGVGSSADVKDLASTHSKIMSTKNPGLL
jgi:collagen type VI alpha